MIYKILKEDFSNNLINSWKNLNVVNEISQVLNDEPMIIGGDILRSDVRLRLQNKSPTIFIHRGYLGNHLYKTRNWWRYSVTSFANTKLLPIPHPRWNLLNLPKHPWKVKNVKRVLLAPSKMTGKIWTPELGDKWAESMLNKFPKAEVRIRPKASTPWLRWSTLWEDLDWADLVVSQSSAITVEAFWYGKKVISTHPCPTWATGEHLFEDWKNPNEPKLRDEWHEHLAWSQFTNSEWISGEANNLIEQYFGSIVNYDPEYSYNFL
jgi:hypothetical protein